MERVSIYARVSTTEQDTSTQVNTLLKYAADRQLEVVEVVEEQASGAKKNRPQLEHLMNLARKRKIDAVLVWKLDRFGRSVSHLVQLLEELRELDVTFISYSDNIDLSTSQGRLQANILSSMAEFERDLISERVKAGMAAAKERGKQIGNKPLEEMKRDMMRVLREGGSTYKDIAAEMGVSLSTVSKYCRGIKPSKRRKKAGRPRTDAETRRLLRKSRKEGYSLRDCADIADCSLGTAQKYLAEKKPKKKAAPPISDKRREALERFKAREQPEQPEVKHIPPAVYEREQQA